MFLIDATPRSGSLVNRAAELLRSPMAHSSVDQSIAELIHQEALSKNVRVIVTAIAEVVATEQIQKALVELDSDVQQKQASLSGMRDGANEIERQLQLPGAEAAIAALSKDVAEQLREGRELLPRLRL